ncbi:hypothetical protein [Haloarcula pellucida]|uniref:Small CPxCG-related zinc finger protein n=1 Tax=Haloarcula pellucida TaxID=1427151 RepID=A0A830GL13_9EURY|nr:hypothetical protein [Halomicroarcula pellucida]MBX0348620.1 hypothetical protein [Halomicroarcula pellucida]GGN92550.1 hypothetical protein GCM10009030_16900 [Halomicroarcula pellucida]
MTLVERLVAYVGVDTATCDRCGETTTVVHECRRCGASVEGHVAECPHCASGRISRYEM